MTAKRPPQVTERRVGRPSKLTPEKSVMLLNLIKAGQPIAAASVAVGIHESTFYRWQQRANEGNPEYQEFFEDLKRAEAECQAMHLANITSHSKVSWQASAWILERRWPQFYGRPRDAPISDGGTDGRRIIIEVLEEPPDEALENENEPTGTKGRE